MRVVVPFPPGAINDTIARVVAAQLSAKLGKQFIVENKTGAGGIIAGELKKGAKVQITGFGNFEARKRAARMGRNPKTGAEIQIRATVAPAFRAGKQLKMAVNKK